MPTETETIKKYPENFEAEQAMLCCILTDAKVGNDVVPSLEEEDFYNERHKRIIAACKALYGMNTSIDVITVYDRLVRLKQAEEDGMDYLVELTSALPSSANFREYYNVLKRDSVLRRLIDASNRIIETAYTTHDANHAMDFAEKEIFAISNRVFSGDLQPIGRASAEVIGRIDDMMRDKNAFRGQMTYFPLLDRYTNGLQKGNLIVVAARPSVGKTAFALNLVSNILQHEPHKKIAFFNLEMSAAELAQRLFSISSNVTMNSINAGTLSDAEQKEMWLVHKQLTDSKIFVDDSAKESPGDVISKCRRLAAREKGIDILFIDYMQLMGSDRRASEANRQLEISDISRQLKILARELKCPVVVLSQMSRSVEQRDDKTPKLSDLRESGAIEQDADIVFFLSRENENDFGKPEYAVLLDIAKHRNGQLGTIRFDWHGTHVRFTESQDQTVNRIFKTQKKG